MASPNDDGDGGGGESLLSIRMRTSGTEASQRTSIFNERYSLPVMYTASELATERLMMVLEHMADKYLTYWYQVSDVRRAGPSKHPWVEVLQRVCSRLSVAMKLALSAKNSAERRQLLRECVGKWSPAKVADAFQPPAKNAHKHGAAELRRENDADQRRVHDLVTTLVKVVR